MSEQGYVIAWTAAGRRALARLPEKVATAPSMDHQAVPVAAVYGLTSLNVGSR